MTSAIQSVIFDKKKYNLYDAIMFLQQNNFPNHAFYDEKKNTYRFRQMDPRIFKRFRTKKIKDGVEFVFGFQFTVITVSKLPLVFLIIIIPFIISPFIHFLI